LEASLHGNEAGRSSRRKAGRKEEMKKNLFVAALGLQEMIYIQILFSCPVQDLKFPTSFSIIKRLSMLNLNNSIIQMK
jgi:hypothetical protein